MKEWSNKYHPFNSMKHCSQIYRWKDVGKKMPPAPASVSLDPSNDCQLYCSWCNSQYIRRKNPKMISKDILLEIADCLPHFTDHPIFGGVEAVCIAGGGEPLTNPYTQDFIDRISEYGIKPGLITNGILLNRFNISKCEWLGVSVDSGTRETYKKLKGKDSFDRVIENISNAVNVEGLISKPGKAHGVSYKFVMNPDNIDDIYLATKLAKEIGCRAFHLRPYAIPYKGQGSPFSDADLIRFRKELTLARKLENDNFQVYGITHKFGDKFEVYNNFDKCYAVAFSCTFQPPTNKGFNITVCCDRRGDQKLTFEDLTMKELKEYWGSRKHLELINSINPQNCPRCTRGPHNKLYEQAIIKENIGYEFG